MILCTMNFLKPEDPEELKIWQSMNQYADAARTSYKFFNEYSVSVSALLEGQLRNREPDKNCVNYPLLDDAETDCTWGIHHYTESEVKEIERSVKRAELEYSGKNCADTTSTHFDEKMHRQYMQDMKTIHTNTYYRLNDTLIDLYTGYMLRRGMLVHDDTNVLYQVIRTIQKAELPLIHQYAADQEAYINIAFYQRTGYNNVKKNIVVVSSKDPELANTVFAFANRDRKVTNVQIVVVPEEQFYDELATLRTAASRYTVVSKKFDSVMTLLSLFRFSLETRSFDEIDPKIFMKTNLVGLYGIAKQEMNVLPTKDVYLLRVPGYSDNYYGVIGELFPIKCNLDEEVKTKILISDKVEVDKFELVDKTGTPISSVDGTIRWEVLERSTEETWNKGCMCYEKNVKHYPDVVSYGKLYQLTIMTNTDCYINIQCHSNLYTDKNPGAMDCFDNNISPKIILMHKGNSIDPENSYDGRTLYDDVTPGFKVIFIPFCSNIKKVDMVKEWMFGCGELADLMQLYAVYHKNSQNPHLVTKKIINHMISNIQVVSGNCIDSAASVGWFYKQPGKECIIPDHQDNWYLRIELKEPVWVYTCMGIQLHLEKDTIRMVSDRGCTYNVLQDVNIHLTPVPGPRKLSKPHCTLKKDYTIEITRNHTPDVVPIIEDDSLIRSDLILKSNIFSKSKYVYTIQFTVADKYTSNPLKIKLFREGFRTDRIRQYYKKRELINEPVWFAACSDARNIDDYTIEYDFLLDDIAEELPAYDLYFYIPALEVTSNDVTYLCRNFDHMVELNPR